MYIKSYVEIQTMAAWNEAYKPPVCVTVCYRENKEDLTDESMAALTCRTHLDIFDTIARILLQPAHWKEVTNNESHVVKEGGHTGDELYLITRAHHRKFVDMVKAKVSCLEDSLDFGSPHVVLSNFSEKLRIS